MTTTTRSSALLMVLLFGLACGENGGITFPIQDANRPPPPAPPGPPAIINAYTLTAQNGVVASDVWQPPEVLVLDANNNLLGAVTVACTVVGGDGSVANPTTTTDKYGHAACAAWTLGPEPGENTLSVTVSGLAPVIFSATGRDQAYFERYDLKSIGGVAVPRQYGGGSVQSGEIRFAPDSTFDQLSVYVDRSGKRFPYFLHGRYERSAELMTLFDHESRGEDDRLFPFAFARVLGDSLTVEYLGEDAGEPEVYRRIN